MSDVNLGIWSRLTRLVIVLLLLAGLLLVGVWYLPLIRQNERMRKDAMRLDAQIQKEEETSRQLKSSIEALRNDPKAVERLAREKLGYAKEGDTVIHFHEAATNQAAVR